MSWKPEITTEMGGEWVGNAIRFATKEEAEIYVKDLAKRWSGVTGTRVIECKLPINYRMANGIPVYLTAIERELANGRTDER